ncbi:AMP-binding protein [Pseudozobellia thermophila]|uniref:O-succinylbenzoic acid--CoA ligase n=1 Tax=Pseudozobellia thermophila TaxID=192903 RepID=A0A1M6LCR0_9FLAO|nr:AMP-binding protein [Pseudozobellia thermophila]SHJ68973.1 O-succinylbenzoic acid--CoA ligase [Pseudozobellia thermophila]
MVNASYNALHGQFRLNGNPYSKDELKEVAYSLVKEGEDFERAIGDFLIDWLNDRPTISVQTSGSTGKPKSIVLQKRHMVNSACATGDFFHLRPGDTALLCLPATYVAGKMMLVRAMVLGLRLDYVSPSSNPLGTNSPFYDFSAMVPLQLKNSLEHLSCIGTLIVGGAPVNPEMLGLVRKKGVSTTIFETYGMTETITHIALKQVHPTAQLPETAFTVLPKVKISTDARGCLVIDAPEIAEGPVVTNDMVRIVSDLEFEWLGRYDNVINSGGVKLFPEQIEAKLGKVIESRFFVAGKKDAGLGQKLILVVEGNPNTDRLIEKIRQLPLLDKFEVPKHVFCVPQFKETASGKVQRSETLASIG